MAKVSYSIRNDLRNSSPHMRRELFPSNDDDTDDLGHMSPLSDSTTSQPSVNINDLAKHQAKNFTKSMFSDYIILENIEAKQQVGRDKEQYNLDKQESHTLNVSPKQITSESPMYKSSTLQMNDTPLRRSSILAMKTPEVMTSPRFPKLIRKTPLNVNSVTEPAKRKFPFSNESPPNNKHKKLEHGSKVRTALFRGSKDAVVPTGSFYSKTNASVGSGLKITPPRVPQSKIKPQAMYLCSRQGNKRRFGQINAGVRHKIRRPKRKLLSNAQILDAVTCIMDNSILNEYLDKSVSTVDGLVRGIVNVPIPVINTQQGCNEKPSVLEKNVYELKITRGRKRELSPEPNRSRKFFKFKRSGTTVTVNKHLNFKVNKEKINLAEKQSNKRNECKIDSEINDLIVPEDDLIPSVDIQNILSDLYNDDDDKENESNVVEIEGNERLILEAHNSVTMSENSIHLHDISNAINKTNESNGNCGVETNEKLILLSPTSQMCNMTSGLALNSPKKLKPNFNSVDDVISSALDMEEQKLYPIFYGGSAKPAPKNKLLIKAAVKKPKMLPKNQMLLDAGQKKFGAKQCHECQLVYHMGDPNDELKHFNYHNAENVFRFNGWKGEFIVSKLPDAKIIRVLPTDPKPWRLKVQHLLKIVNRELGYYDLAVSLDNSQVYLYVRNKRISGCLVAESRAVGYKLLTEDVGIDLCSEETYSIKCGINRLWVSEQHRKQGIASSLLNSLRGNFMYGTILTKDDIAFSSPTEAGKAFATKYFNTPNFLIYI